RRIGFLADVFVVPEIREREYGERRAEDDDEPVERVADLPLQDHASRRTRRQRAPLAYDVCDDLAQAVVEIPFLHGFPEMQEPWVLCRPGRLGLHLLLAAGVIARDGVLLHQVVEAVWVERLRGSLRQRCNDGRETLAGRQHTARPGRGGNRSRYF